MLLCPWPLEGKLQNCVEHLKYAHLLGSCLQPVYIPSCDQRRSMRVPHLETSYPHLEVWQGTPKHGHDSVGQLTVVHLENAQRVCGISENFQVWYALKGTANQQNCNQILTLLQGALHTQLPRMLSVPGTGISA